MEVDSNLLNKYLFCIGNKQVCWSELEGLHIPSSIFMPLAYTLAGEGQLVLDRDEIVIPEGVITLPSLFSTTDIKSIHLPSTMRCLENQCFSFASDLKEVTGTENLAQVGQYAFASSGIELSAARHSDCLTYKNLYLYNRDPAETVVLDDTITCIADGAFLREAPAELEKVVLSPQVRIVPKSCFKSQVNLKHIETSGTLTEIGSDAFNNCYSISEIPSSETIEEIGVHAFSRTGVLKADLPVCKRLGTGAFFSCKSLVEVSLPNVEAIDELAFAFCHSLRSVKFGSKLNFIGSKVFESDMVISVEEISLSRKTVIRDQNLLHEIGRGTCRVKYID